MVVSLVVAEVVLALNINWRVIFWIGALIALIGSAARFTLRESPEFSDAKRRLLKIYEEANQSSEALNENSIWQEKVSRKTSLAYFLVFCGWPFCFYFSYIYCGIILKNQFHYTKEALIHQNLIVSIVNLAGLFTCVWLTKIIHPLVILKAKLIIYFPFLCVVPWLLLNSSSESTILLIQVLGLVLGNSTIPAKAIFLMHFPVFKRFRYASFITAIAHVTLYIITSFGLVYAVDFLGVYGILLISLPVTLSFLLGLLHFEKLEKAAGTYHYFLDKINKKPLS